MPIFSGHRAKRRHEILVVVLLILVAVLGAIVGRLPKVQERAPTEHMSDDLEGSRRQPTPRARELGMSRQYAREWLEELAHAS